MNMNTGHGVSHLSPIPVMIYLFELERDLPFTDELLRWLQWVKAELGRKQEAAASSASPTWMAGANTWVIFCFNQAVSRELMGQPEHEPVPE